MAFISRIGSLIKQSGSKNVSIGLSSSNSPLFQTLRSMSSAKLFVGGLAYATDEVGLKEAFQQYGEVIESKVIVDRDSGRSRGFGFVSYTSADAANTAMQDMDGKELHGRRIRVNFAQERPRPSFGGGSYGGAGGYGGGGGAYGGAGGYGGGGGYGGAGGYSGGGGGGYGGSNNVGGYGGRNVGGYADSNQNVAGDIFSGGLDGSPAGGNEDNADSNVDHNLTAKEGGDDFEVDDYANTSNK
ncbi:nucleotide-binding alpha-beta plait domain-containing protein [Artemisia annua]|uniref:Nucleotide-binding alpha-beta plait domain-containing protein n=1 Tax=Artemisia annua TaxID=35608 RepID=A0A2U1NIE8_ARTAN|nr:nucleotide-binding alpha-beta plait domain-containing protein [Artemisia annua]